MNIPKITKNLHKYMLLYTILIIIIGTICGYYIKVSWASALILPIVFIMIYPMMVNVSFESLKFIKKSIKPLIVGLIINFIFAPLLILLLAFIFHIPNQLFIALILLAIAPASSMGLGYVGLSKGNMITASIIVASAFLLSILVYPITMGLIGVSSNAALPIGSIIKSLLIVLVLPLILGVTTRELLIERRDAEYEKAKPYFSFITLSFLYILIFLIFFMKGPLLLAKIGSLYNIFFVAILFYPLTILFVLILNKYILKLDYEHHQSIVFTTVSKNVALTIGILSVSFGESGHFMALIPAIFSLIQIIFLMSYLHFNSKIISWWSKNAESSIVKDRKSLEAE